MLERFNPIPHTYKDKNGKKIKDGDVITIHNDKLIQEGKRVLIRYDYVPERYLFHRIPIIYNPNCCRYCRNGNAYLWEIDEIDENEIEIIGNIKTNPELLPFKTLEEL